MLFRKPLRIIIRPRVSVLKISQSSSDVLKIFHYKKLQLSLSTSYTRSWAEGWEAVGSTYGTVSSPYLAVASTRMLGD